MSKKRPILWLALVLAVLMALPMTAWAEPVISNEVVITPVPEEPIDPDQPVVEPGLALYASLSPDVCAPGGTPVLSVVLANTGDTLATGQIVTCTLPVGLDLLDPGALSYDSATRTITWNVEVPAGQMATMTAALSVSASSTNGMVYSIPVTCGEMSTLTALTVTDSDLRLYISSDVKRADPGDPVVFTIDLQNLGDAPANGVNLTCYTDGMIVDLGQITGGGVYEAYQINWTLDVPARSLVTVKYSADIPDDAFGGDVYTAQALAAGLSAEAPVTVREAEPLLTVSKWVNNRTPAPGTTVKYTIEVSNDGSGDAYDVRVVDHLPAALDIYTRSISDGGDYDSYDDTIEWYVDVPAYDTVTLTFKAYVPDWAEDGDTYVNRVNVPGWDSARSTLVVTEDAVPKTGYGDEVIPAAWQPASGQSSGVVETAAAADAAPVASAQTDSAQLSDIPDQPLPGIQASFQELYNQNNDLAGWLKVAEQVDQPIVQHEGNDYYMIHDFEGQEDDAGALFLDERNHLYPRDQHLLIYGHNMNDGSMFGQLSQYRDLEYLKANPTFTFQSVYDQEPTTYVVIAVVDASMDVGNADYLKIRVPNFDDEQAMLDFVASLKDFSYFDIPVETTQEDQLLSLVTCSYFQDNGRLLVVGRALREGESAEDAAALVAQSVKVK